MERVIRRSAYYGTAHSQLRIVYLSRCTMRGPGALCTSSVLCAQTRQAPPAEGSPTPLGWSVPKAHEGCSDAAKEGTLAIVTAP